MEGDVDEDTMILIDYNTIKTIIERFDHQIILNRDDPMVPCIEQFQTVVTTPGDPTSELLAQVIRDDLDRECGRLGISARTVAVRVWESHGCYAEIGNADL